jgi:hypothetical protein
LENDDIEEGWRLVGEQSQWVIELINAYKEDALTIGQFTQFMHFFINAVGLGMHSVMKDPFPIKTAFVPHCQN